MRNDIHLRELMEKDAEGMYEWMHDEEAGRGFRKKMSSKTMDDILAFIRASGDRSKNVNFAICDASDEYLGTISLKNLDQTKKNAEYAIALRKKARGCGVGEAATRLLAEYAFGELEIDSIYLNVLAENERAIKLYQKCGFVYQKDSEEVFEEGGEIRKLHWYVMDRNKKLL